MELFVDHKLNPYAFEIDIRQGTKDLNNVLLAAVKTESASVESTHFLIALSKVPGSFTQKTLTNFGLTSDHWQSGLSTCVQKTSGDLLPPTHLTENCFHESAISLLRTAQIRCAKDGLKLISEPILLLSALENATEAVRQLCESVDIDLEKWCNDIELTLRPITPIPVFEEDEIQAVLMESFSPGARKVLTLLKGEAESMGYDIVDPRHLLLALLMNEDGATHHGIHYQGLAPNKLREAVTLNLRSKAGTAPNIIPLDYIHLQPVLRDILVSSGELAGRDHAQQITEPHLLRAFLSIESAALRILEMEGVNLISFLDTAERYDITQEDEEDTTQIDIQTIRENLLLRLVGQDDAIERILPYIQRMRFGFSTPDRPVGVFLFCGQSGSGKTEMAKELSRVLYGSEDNLIYLEMGQFNAPESMNIFVGAPHGYVGYGEGKLTNGLKDKPRSVVLFDEVEKAHSRVLDALLRFLDEGKIDDPAGPVRDGTQCILILTSNVASKKFSQLWSEIENNPNWRSLVRQKLRHEFERHNFRIEFLNRVDELILFRTLGRADYIEIANRLLKRDLERLRRERQIEVSVDPGVTKAIGAYCATISEGARMAQRLTQSVVMTPVIDFVMQNSCISPVRLRVMLSPDSTDPAIRPSGQVEFA